jgi:N-carbamoylputrescine amidase
MDPELRPGTQAWKQLRLDLERAQPDLFVLNELAFGAWLAARETFDPVAWKQSVEDHEAGVAALDELGVPVVVGSRAVERSGRRCNEGFVWTRDAGAVGAHTKQHIPNSPGYRETTWTEPGERAFEIVQAGPLRLGFLICTDIMFNEHARQYGRNDVDLIVVPRAMPPLAADLFDVALRMAAIVSGCYVASSNRGGTDSAGEPFEGRGCIVDPTGQTVAQTSPFHRVVVHEVSTEFVAWKKSIYPCNVV